RCAVQAQRRPPDHPPRQDTAQVFARRTAPAVERAEGRHESRRPAPTTATRGLRLRGSRSPSPVHQAGSHGHVADQRSIRPELGRQRATRPVLRRELVGRGRPAHHLAHVPRARESGGCVLMTPMTDPNGLRIAMLGTRGVPAAYGGFETAVEEIGRRLVERGHTVTVYCRNSKTGTPVTSHLGMQLVHLPALRLKAAETLSHTALSVAHIMFSAKPDLAFVFNAANAPFVPWLRMLGVPAAVHVDGLEWKRDKWNGAGRRYYLSAEKLAVRTADALIADAQGIADYYTRKFRVETELLTYGTKIIRNPESTRLGELGIRPHEYHLVVARFEPENHVDLIIEGYHLSNATYPLVVVGSAGYPGDHADRITALAASDQRIRLLGGLWD